MDPERQKEVNMENAKYNMNKAAIRRTRSAAIELTSSRMAEEREKRRREEQNTEHESVRKMWEDAFDMARVTGEVGTDRGESLPV